ncbi:MFS general substrate transporter [Pluteus cervinus]|uniref:MFS general substrate transporter n=1 Tax=Pluteus cervinus TaxID=181527 RepID=A0ACD3AUF5_9AGAR|nr:MFS general substrate transporter [Pluteus cervinus]
MEKSSPFHDKELRLKPSSSSIPNSLENENRVWRKLDLYILPVLAIFYLLSFLDRTNLGNARIAGLQKDLKMTNKQYSIALTVTYIPYILAELPSNLLLKIIGPNLMLPAMLTLWGIVTTLQGVITTYRGLLICRFFLGLLEGGLFPGLALYCSTFYPRNMLNTRITLFFSAASISGAFSGLLAYGIINMDGVGHKPGWAWIFILEGMVTVVFGVVSFGLLPGTPRQARFLSDEEKDYVERRLKEDHEMSGKEGENEFSWKEVGRAFKSPQLWFLLFPFFVSGVLVYSLAYFTPTIVQGLGYTAARAQLMSVPPFAVGFVVSLLGAYLSDHFSSRGLLSILTTLLTLTGALLFLLSPSSPHRMHVHIQYLSLFFLIPGAYTMAPCLCTWLSNNSHPHTRRATSIALSFMCVNTGGVLATWLWGSLSKAPDYKSATIVMIVLLGGELVCLVGNWGWLKRENGRKVRRREVYGRGGGDEGGDGRGDGSPWFVYSL